uniref:Uncharacterized protein n=2 Tax=Picea TaxID=3328 RepID=A0A101LXU9_PICGL|nr:hypothetical protein ABT39_MTgene5539 [Picea glauca]QHR91653.1 hypothetical protein Q903MT_gene5689 [Picea sitchensis]
MQWSLWRLLSPLPKQFLLYLIFAFWNWELGFVLPVINYICNYANQPNNLGAYFRWESSHSVPQLLILLGGGTGFTGYAYSAAGYATGTTG